MIVRVPLNVIIQRLDSGNVWDGTVPTTAVTYPLDANKEIDGVARTVEYAVHTAGGLFNIETCRNNFKRLVGHKDRVVDSVNMVEQISMVLGGQTTWSLAMTDGTDSVVLFSGTNETSFFQSELKIVLEPGWYLSLTSVGNSTRDHMCMIQYLSTATALLIA